MNTEDLIRALANDTPARRASLQAMFALALAIGFGAAFALFMVLIGPRPDIATAAQDPRFLLKFVVTLALAAVAAGLVLRLSRPAAPLGGWAIAIGLAPALLALGLAYELFSIPSTQWGARLVGRNAAFCLISIPLLAAPLLAALMAMLRQGATTRPALAGAVAGLLAGGLGAALYAAHCVDDSPLFVATWYGIAIAGVALVGAAVGARALKW